MMSPLLWIAAMMVVLTTSFTDAALTFNIPSGGPVAPFVMSSLGSVETTSDVIFVVDTGTFTGFDVLMDLSANPNVASILFSGSPVGQSIFDFGDVAFLGFFTCTGCSVTFDKLMMINVNLDASIFFVSTGGALTLTDVEVLRVAGAHSFFSLSGGSHLTIERNDWTNVTIDSILFSRSAVEAIGNSAVTVSDSTFSDFSNKLFYLFNSNLSFVDTVLSHSVFSSSATYTVLSEGEGTFGSITSLDPSLSMVSFEDSEYSGNIQGFLESSYTVVNVLNSKFEGNNMTNFASVIRLGGYVWSTFLASNFTENLDGSPGCIFAAGEEFFAENCRFVGNVGFPNIGALNLDAKVCVVVNSLFEGNTAARGSGGAISVDTYVQAFILNTTFIGNTATGPALYSGAFNGGAIVISFQSDVRIVNSKFESNHAEDFGGAISIDSDNPGREDNRDYFNEYPSVYGNWKLAVSRSTFDNNTAGDSGGAVHTRTTSAYFGHSRFSLNSAVNYGGATFSELNCDVTFFDVSLSTNSAGGNGGSCYFSEGFASFTDSVIELSTATYAGGGINAENAGVALVNCHVTQNSAMAASGGGVRVYVGTLDVHASLIDLNMGQGSGGIDFYSGGCELCGTSGYNSDWYLMQNVVCWVTASVVQGNTANYGSGGGIWIESDSRHVVLYNVDILNNFATFNGGGAFITSPSSTNFRLFFFANVTFAYNNAPLGDGGGLYNQQISAIGRNLMFTSNTASNFNGVGGGMAAFNSVWTIEGLVVHNNSADSGGGLAITEFTDRRSVVEEPLADSRTSDIYGSSYNADIVNGHITNNEAFKNGGGLLVYNNAVRLTSVEVELNYASLNGGGLYSDAGVFDGENIAVTNNSATALGGGLHFYLSLTNLTASVVSYNDAQIGGGLFLLSSGETWLNGADVEGNVARSSGGGVVLSGSASLLAYGGTTVVGNTAEGFEVSSSIDISSSGARNGGRSYDSCSGGGGVYVAPFISASSSGSSWRARSSTMIAGEVTFINCWITDNSAAVNGGGLFSMYPQPITLSHVVVSRNTAMNGGAVATSCSPFNLFNAEVTAVTSTFSDNVAGSFGGAFYGDNVQFSVEDSFVVRNTAVEGGGMYVITPVGLVNSSVTIRTTVVNSNQALVAGAVRLGHLTWYDEISGQYSIEGSLEAGTLTVFLDRAVFRNNVGFGIVVIANANANLLSLTINGNSLYPVVLLNCTATLSDTIVEDNLLPLDETPRPFPAEGSISILGAGAVSIDAFNISCNSETVGLWCFESSPVALGSSVSVDSGPDSNTDIVCPLIGQLPPNCVDTEYATVVDCTSPPVVCVLDPFTSPSSPVFGSDDSSSSSTSSSNEDATLDPNESTSTSEVEAVLLDCRSIVDCRDCVTTQGQCGWCSSSGECVFVETGGACRTELKTERCPYGNMKPGGFAVLIVFIVALLLGGTAAGCFFAWRILRKRERKEVVTQSGLEFQNVAAAPKNATLVSNTLSTDVASHIVVDELRPANGGLSLVTTSSVVHLTPANATTRRVGEPGGGPDLSFDSNIETVVPPPPPSMSA